MSYSYDSNGNLTQKVDASTTWTYEWNAENQLTRVLSNASEVARYKYDPLGRRVEKVAASATTAWAYDSEDILRETSGAATWRYLHGPGVDEPLAKEDGTGALVHFHADALGSITKTTNPAGTVVASYSYDGFGSPTDGPAGYAFTGREWDSHAELYYYRARYYDPKQARFITEDPIGFGGGFNFFAYVGNDPINRTDPSGLQSRRTSPSPSPSPNCAQICAMAMSAKDPGMRSGGGGVVCFNGQKCPCVFGLPPSHPAAFAPGECPELDNEIRGHEEQHIPETACPTPKGLCRAGFRIPYDPRLNECTHRRTSNLNMLTTPSSSSRCERARRFLIAKNDEYLRDKCR